MDDKNLRREFQEIRNSVDALTQGLVLIGEGLETQTEMLKQILEAATKEPEQSPLGEMLEKMIKTLNAQTEVLVRFGEAVNNVGPEVERAVIRGIHRATGAVNSDGEIQD